MLKVKRSAKILNILSKIKECLETGRYYETVHVQERKLQRDIILQDIIYVLTHGRHEKAKDKFDEEYLAWNYAIRGFLVDKEEMRVIVSFDEEDDMLIITAFHL